MKSINEVRLLGTLGRDAETSYIQSGSSVTKFSVATERSWKNKQTGEWEKETDWTNVVAWKLADSVCHSLLKGSRVYVGGRLTTRSYEDKSGVKKYVTEVVADDVIALGDAGMSPKSASGTSGLKSQPRSVSRTEPQSREDPPMIDESDVPF